VNFIGCAGQFQFLDDLERLIQLQNHTGGANTKRRSLKKDRKQVEKKRIFSTIEKIQVANLLGASVLVAENTRARRRDGSVERGDTVHVLRGVLQHAQTTAFVFDREDRK
jgi:hypothetical protein